MIVGAALVISSCSVLEHNSAVDKGIGLKLKGTGYTEYFYYYKGHNFWDFLFAFLLKKVYSKRKEFAPTRSKFFPFREDLFQKGTKTELPGRPE